MGKFIVMERKEKRAYETEEEALNHLRHIVETNNKPWKMKGNKKPIRAYLDPRDGLYYLTSKPQIKIY